jgi:hypothetical protein
MTAMKPDVLAVFHYAKILGAVVISYMVDVVDMFATLDRSSDHPFGNQPMFEDIALPVRLGMGWGMDIDVAL